MVLPVYIEDKEILIHSTQDFIDEGSTGTCYKVDSELGTLNVKLFNDYFYTYPNSQSISNEEVIKKFQKLAPYTDPILLSKYLVRDSDGTYIGCARDFVEQNDNGSLSSTIFHLPTQQVIDCFQILSDKIAIFNAEKIALSDWALYNAMYGHIGNGEDTLYLLDDGDYLYPSHGEKVNDLQLRHLVEDITKDYLSILGFYSIFPNISSDIHASYSPIHFLQGIGDGYSTLSEGAIQYAKRKLKK